MAVKEDRRRPAGCGHGLGAARRPATGLSHAAPANVRHGPGAGRMLTARCICRHRACPSPCAAVGRRRR
ncbi:hypothetical protein RGE_11430 [Rubrivivax gelatinosus IL144]|uniref:Uncharacterized protein n=1 Tax=Rubrivivax gelatinosus (strain NBRC 100245 / IL144) TaxID=983917 RepID=I0HN97_RUBGI|nr:hypothetical protein RGE_11430 [Rubrivivax gelatinosus IL144]